MPRSPHPSAAMGSTSSNTKKGCRLVVSTFSCLVVLSCLILLTLRWNLLGEGFTYAARSATSVECQCKSEPTHDTAAKTDATDQGGPHQNHADANEKAEEEPFTFLPIRKRNNNNPQPQPVDKSTLPASTKFRMDASQLDKFMSHEALESVEGWLFPGAMLASLILMRLQLEVHVQGAVGEIGVHHGKLTTFLAFFARQSDFPSSEGDGKHFFVADLFEGMQHLNVDNSGKGDKGSFSKAMGFSQTKLEDMAVFVGPSQNVTKEYFERNHIPPFRFFSVDGGHTRETALSDMLLIGDHVADGAVVMLDDFLRGEWWGVTEAAIEYERKGNGKLVPFCFIGNKLFYTTPSHVAFYRNGLQADPVLSTTRWTKVNDLSQHAKAGHLLNIIFGEVDWYDDNPLNMDPVKAAGNSLLKYFDA